MPHFEIRGFLVKIWKRLKCVVENGGITGHFSVKVDLTQLRKYRSLCNCQVNLVGVENLLFFRIRTKMSFGL